MLKRYQMYYNEAVGNIEQELLEREEYQAQRAFSGTETLIVYENY